MQSQYRSGLGWRIFDAASRAIDRRLGWDRLPTPLGLAVLIGVRDMLRQRNLYDTDQRAVDQRLPPLAGADPRT